MRRLLVSAVLSLCATACGPAESGADGATDETGATGETGAAGAVGPQGPAGTSGANGADGASSLVRAKTEPAGANCANGGIAVETGIDANGNGVLDDSEVQASSTTYVCNGEDAAGPPCGVLEGSFYINNARDVQALAGCTGVSGNLTIQAPGLTSLAGLTSLKSVGGSLSISYNHDLTSLSGLENLESVGLIFYIAENESLTSLSGLDGLTSVGEILRISDNDALTSLNGLGSLTSVEGFLNIINNKSLTSLSGLESLESVGVILQIYDNESLPQCEADALATQVGRTCGLSSPTVCYENNGTGGCN